MRGKTASFRSNAYWGRDGAQDRAPGGQTEVDHGNGTSIAQISERREGQPTKHWYVFFPSNLVSFLLCSGLGPDVRSWLRALSA